MKKNNFNIIYFLLVFLFFYYGFYTFVGFLTPGGRYYSSFLDHYLNIPYWLTALLSKAAVSLLRLAGYNAYQKKPSNVTIAGGHGVNIAWACLGFGVMSCWTAFVIAHKQSIVFKVKWIVTGIFLICLINIIRIMMIALSLHYHWIGVQAFNAHTTFNIVAYIFILLLMFVFVHYYNRRNQSITTI